MICAFIEGVTSNLVVDGVVLFVLSFVVRKCTELFQKYTQIIYKYANKMSLSRIRKKLAEVG